METKLMTGTVPCISRLLFLASTTKPIWRCIGLVVEANNNIVSWFNIEIYGKSFLERTLHRTLY